MPLWRRAILIGQAKRLASMSDDERSAWGRSMLAKRGGYAVRGPIGFKTGSQQELQTKVGASASTGRNKLRSARNKLQESPT